MSNKSAGATPRFRDDSAGLGRISITAEPAPRTIGNAAGSGIEPDETPFDLAELLRELDRAGATELAERLAVAKSAIHGHLTTLRDRGFVVKRSGRYELGLRFFEYGQCARSQLEIVQSGTLAVEKLEAETREMVWLLTHQNGMAIYVYGRAGDNEVSVNTILGARTHTHCNSGGREGDPREPPRVRSGGYRRRLPPPVPHGEHQHRPRAVVRRTRPDQGTGARAQPQRESRGHPRRRGPPDRRRRSLERPERGRAHTSAVDGSVRGSGPRPTAGCDRRDRSHPRVPIGFVSRSPRKRV